MEGATYYYYGFPKNPVNDWLVAEHQKRFNGPPDFFTAGGMAAGIAVVEALKKAGSTDTEKLIAAMEGLSFDTPKGKMTFRKEDHQAHAVDVPLQDQGRAARSTMGRARAGARDPDRGHAGPDPEQALATSDDRARRLRRPRPCMPQRIEPMCPLSRRAT